MNIEVKALRFTLPEDSREYLDRKITRIHNAENMIVDLLFTFKKDKTYGAEAKVNFRWGVTIYVTEQDFELNAAIDKMVDKLEAKINKEKEKTKKTSRGRRSSRCYYSGSFNCSCRCLFLYSPVYPFLTVARRAFSAGACRICSCSDFSAGARSTCCIFSCRDFSAGTHRTCKDSGG